MNYLLGIDFGGTSSKATLINEHGDIICTSSREYPMHYPVDGWSEFSPDDCYNACIYNIKRIIESSGIRPADIVAVAVDSATHMAVLLDENDRVIRPVIHWSDRRSFEECIYLNEKYLEDIKRMTLNAPSPLWTLPQLMWLNKHEPENMAKVSRLLFMKDYIRHKLTGDYATDRIEAMGAMLMDEEKGQWSPELCALAGVSLSAMPELKEPSDFIGYPTAKACDETGLSPKTKVIVGTTDTVMEVFASGAVHPGQATVKLATAGRICPITDHGICHEMLVNYRHVVPGLWYPGTTNKTCAASYRWYRDVLCKEEMMEAEQTNVDAYELMDKAAMLVPAGSDGLCFHPYLQGEASPYNDSNLRASFVGVSSFHTKGHFSRAVMEGVCFSLRDSIDLLKDLGIAPASANIIGGGARSPMWSQMTADILNLPLKKAKADDSSLGSAMLAGVAVGVFSSYEDAASKCARADKLYLPNPKNVETYNYYFARYKAIHDALAPIYKAMPGIKP